MEEILDERSLLACDTILDECMEHESGMAYLKIGHKGAPPGKDFYPLEHLYPIEIGKGEE